jgi:hypothetical protein
VPARRACTKCSTVTIAYRRIQVRDRVNPGASISTLTAHPSEVSRSTEHVFSRTALLALLVVEEGREQMLR